MAEHDYASTEKYTTYTHNEEFRGNTQNPEVHTIFISFPIHMKFLTPSLLPYICMNVKLIYLGPCPFYHNNKLN
jgi:hypothetical protein